MAQRAPLRPLSALSRSNHHTNCAAQPSALRTRPYRPAGCTSSNTAPARQLSSTRRRHETPEAQGQAQALDGFYAELLSYPMRKRPSTLQSNQSFSAAPSSPHPSAQTPPSTDTASTDDMLDDRPASVRAAGIFGARLTGAARRAELDAQGRRIAGVLIPPRPQEPDNCCMSGCVNCVWDGYREEIEVWAERCQEAAARLAEQRRKGEGEGATRARQAAGAQMGGSMDDDGGGSAGFDVEGLEEDFGGAAGGMLDAVPIGIREFMRTEKLLKQRHGQPEAAASPDMPVPGYE